MDELNNVEIMDEPETEIDVESVEEVSEGAGVLPIVGVVTGIIGIGTGIVLVGRWVKKNGKKLGKAAKAGRKAASEVLHEDDDVIEVVESRVIEHDQETKTTKK